ncbi:MAG TPA: site-specific integrase, partial [Salinimicrobium sp.]|nr:site-specific integrase [Salinimicrobium sp.]
MNWQHALKDYGNYLRIERGLANNSVLNYTFDVEKLMAYLKENEISDSPINISEEVVQQFIYEISKNVNARSQSRIISGLKSFFSFLIFEDYRKNNPADLIESPK